MRSLQVGPNLHEINAQNEKQRKKRQIKREGSIGVTKIAVNLHSAYEQFVRCALQYIEELSYLDDFQHFESDSDILESDCLALRQSSVLLVRLVLNRNHHYVFI